MSKTNWYVLVAATVTKEYEIKAKNREAAEDMAKSAMRSDMEKARFDQGHDKNSPINILYCDEAEDEV